jgi:hypothetical protein
MACGDRPGKLIDPLSCYYTHYSISLQPIAAFEHPAFQRMMHIASRATRGITLLNRKQTRDRVVSLFKSQMNDLKRRLNVRFHL